MRVITCIATMHNPWLVILAALVCISGTLVAMELLKRAAVRNGPQRLGWIFLAAIACGTSVWCTHFIAMLAYDPGAPVAYDPILTIASLLLIIVGAGVSFCIGASLRKSVATAAGVLLGLSVAAMHYTGMAAYHVDGIVEWDLGYLAASVALAALFGAISIRLFQARRPRAAAASFVIAVVSLHFTGMAAVSVTPFVTGAQLVDGMAAAAMAVAVAGGALIIVVTGIISQMIDTAASQDNLSTLRHMALNDGLTGLPNRNSFNEFLAGSVERADAEGDKVAVIGIDLDRFKEINDIYGHSAGDEVLKSLSRNMSASLRSGEFVARIGGDEFAAVKQFSEISEISEFVARLERELGTPTLHAGVDLAAAASFGISIYPQDSTSPSRLVANADLAMYRAKRDVARSSCYYEAEMDERARARSELALELKRAIDLNQLELHYQIKSSVNDLHAVGYEVLLRWKHPTLGYVPPVEFIPLAEETGSILAIGEWVLRNACLQAASFKTPHRIAVNLSALQLTNSDLPRIVHEILLETGLPASRLELEITETAIILDKARSLHTLRQIKALGVTIALDDFGTGYSSLDTLRSFPFDRIKLDRSFMEGIEHNIQARAIIRAVLALGKSLDISLLAEGVETVIQLRLLADEGCDEVQGYLLGRPGPVLTEAVVGLMEVKSNAA